MKNPSRVLLDTDVVINWLVQEVETVSGKELWKAPHEIVKRSEAGEITVLISLTTLFEIRFLLRRKKSFSSRQVEDDLTAITSVIDVIIPDEISLLRANTLQAEHPLDPFDAIHLSLCMGMEPIALISRDDDFIKISRKFITAQTPEEFLNALRR
jgi:PIN domain nuclease of toxin-antitoxin system